MAKSVSEIATHVQENHKGIENCEFCEFKADNREDMTDHMIEKHEDLGVLNMLSFQQRYVIYSFDLFKQELTTVIKGLIEGQNVIKQELFIMRQNQVTFEAPSEENPAPASAPVLTS